MVAKKNIAIIGGGIGGLTAAYYLNKKHRIKLFEKQNRLGGNAYSIDASDGNQVDIAVAAFGKEGYGDFFALLDELGLEVDLCPNTFMSIHNLDTKEGLYLTPSIKAGISQGFDMMKPKHLKSIYDLFKGLKEARKLQDKGALTGLTMRECIEKVDCFRGNTKLYLIFCLCLLSSMSAEEVLDTSACFFLDKLKVHNDVLSPKSIFSVVALKGGTRSYVTAMSNTFKDNIVLESKIKSVFRTEDQVTLKMEDGTEEIFDAVIFACNADQALALIENPTDKEKELLGVWDYKEGRVVVHQDHQSFPARELIQAYTYLYTIDEETGEINTSVNGALRFEPQVSDDSNLISSQHPNFPIREELIEFDTVLRTPVFSFESIGSIPRMPSLNGTLNSYYCGSHFGYGLHNDAISSAKKVVRLLGGDVPAPKSHDIGASVKDLFKMASKFRR